MDDIKFSAKWACTGAIIALVVFGINFWVVQGALPGYKILAYPGILITRLFSEEIDFWPKLSILVFGQYTIYFLVILGCKKLKRLCATI